MKKISHRELYDLYLDTLRHCTSQLFNLSDEEIGYELFEEFDVGAHSFLHDDSLARLYKEGYISQGALEESKEIRRRWSELHAPVPSIAEIKSSERWRDLFEHCDKLRRKLERLENGPKGRSSVS
jgi:hypothetical protein